MGGRQMNRFAKILAVMAVVAVITATTVVFVQTRPKRMTFFVYDRDAKPPWAGGNKKTSEGYKIIAKWDGTVDFSFNPYNPQGLDSSFIRSALIAASNEWDDHTSYDLVGLVEEDLDAGFHDSMNGENEVSFGDYPTSGVIAVCRMWVTRGKPSDRRILEFDILFDTDYSWGDATEDSSVMDLQNIATHELGHGIAGLDDIYDEVYSDITMYGYSDYGETKKRTLEQPDIDGLQANYGE